MAREIRSFTVTIHIEGHALQTQCPWGGPTEIPTAETTPAVTLQCSFTLWEVASRDYDIVVQVTSAEGSYDGQPVAETWTDDEFNGKGCGSCSGGEAIVVVQ